MKFVTEIARARNVRNMMHCTVHVPECCTMYKRYYLYGVSLPRNSMSLLNFAANDTQYFSESHNMKLNPPKCKQMVINFMHNHNFSLNPILLGNDVIETVRVYKLLGIILSHDLTWTNHVDYIYKKSNKRLYFIRFVKEIQS